MAGLVLQAVALLLVARTLGAAPAGLYVTYQYVAGAAGPLVVLGMAGARDEAQGMVLAAAIALGGAVAGAANSRIARGPTRRAAM